MYWSKCSEGRWLLACMDSLLYIIDLQRYQHSTLDVLCINKMYWSWKQSRSWYRNTELTKPRRSLNTNSCVCRLLKRFFLGEHLIAPTIWSDHRSLLHPVIARLQRPCNHSAIWWWHRWSCKWWWWSNDGVSCMQPAKPVPWVRSPYQVHWIGQTESNCNGLQCVWRSLARPLTVYTAHAANVSYSAQCAGGYFRGLFNGEMEHLFNVWLL